MEVRIEYSKKKEINGTTYNAVWDLLSLSLSVLMYWTISQPML
ncbi:hypothetical protein [Sulfuricurvum sp. RIFCSPLOWO2_12_FULL_43_24]|nr:hypothetical protein [Sulfuricurvum sp. RIFCSPLOWO2_12_FULL_43_24]